MLSEIGTISDFSVFNVWGNFRKDKIFFKQHNRNQWEDLDIKVKKLLHRIADWQMTERWVFAILEILSISYAEYSVHL